VEVKSGLHGLSFDDMRMPQHVTLHIIGFQTMSDSVIILSANQIRKPAVAGPFRLSKKSGYSF
jgi:hypothetical protein